MVPLKIKSKGMFLASVLLMVVGTQMFSFGGNTAITPLLMAIGGYDYYPLVAALGSAGTMIILPACGAICNKLGQRNSLILGVVMMVIGRCAMLIESSNVVLLMVWQVIGSIGSGFMMTAPYVLIAMVFEQIDAMKYYGFVASATGIGATIGPLLAGALVDAGLTRLAFIIWLPLYVIAFAVIFYAFPNIKLPSVKFDVKGLILLAIIVTCFVLWTGLSGTAFPWISAGLILPAIVIVAAILLVKHSEKVENPTVPLRVFKNKRVTIAFLTNLTQVVVPTCLTGYVLVYILNVMQLNATIGSTCSVPYTICNTILGFFFGAILAKNFVKNVRTLGILAVFGAIVCVGILCMLTPTSPMWLIWVASAFGGIPACYCQSCMTPFFQFGLPAEDFGAAQGIYTFAATGGATVFVSIVGVLVNATGDIKMVFYGAAVMIVIMAITVFTGVRITPEEAAAAAQQQGQ